MAAQGDEPHGGGGGNGVKRPATLAQGRMKQSDVLKDGLLKRIGELVVQGDSTAEASDGLPAEDCCKSQCLLGFVADAQSFEEDGVGGLVL